jgi:glycosyl transferase family 25
MKLLQHILYINLEHRTDRKEHLLQQIDNLNQRISEKNLGNPLQPERFDAIRHPTHGALGCSQSHLECLKIAREKEYPQICIMEDDILFSEPELLLTQLGQFQDEFKSSEWDVLMIGGNIFRSSVVPGKTSCNQVINAQVAVGYIVQQHYYDTLIENFTNGLACLNRQPTKRASYAVDMYWKRLQPQHKWFVLKPLMIKQLPNYSDIERRQVNYDRCMSRLR